MECNVACACERMKLKRSFGVTKNHKHSLRVTYVSLSSNGRREREREMFYLTTHSTHFIYGYMASDIWLRTILIVRKETRCRHIGYSYRLTARVLLYAPSLRQDNTYHGLCYINIEGRKEGNVLFNDALNTFYLRLYGMIPLRGTLR